MRILLVEDDADLAEVVALGLRNEAYAVDVRRHVRRGRGAAAARPRSTSPASTSACPTATGSTSSAGWSRDPDLRRPRRTLVLTARDAVDDRVAGLDAGADDYLVKPFALRRAGRPAAGAGPPRPTSTGRRCGSAT